MSAIEKVKKEEILKIMSESGMPVSSVLPFELVSNYLIDCSAKKKLPANPRTVIVSLFPYYVREDSQRNISLYACIPDYHKVVRKYLDRACSRLVQRYPENEFVPFVDSSPIPEVAAAALAGQGFAGKNGLLIHPEYGSFLFIGEIVTDLEIKLAGRFEFKSGCGSCEICINGCPVNCIADQTKKTACLSAISQKRSLTQRELDLLYEKRIIWGCDICQQLCPYNKKPKQTFITEFLEGYIPDIRRIDPDDYQHRAFNWRGREVISRNINNIYNRD